MKRGVIHGGVVILAIVITHWFGHFPLTNAGTQWTISGAVKLEERPYTTPQDVTQKSKGPTHLSKVNKLLYPSLREMQRYCDGQCFYAPSDCDNLKYNCKLIASIAMHNPDLNGELYCDYFGRDNLRESFCYNSEAQKAFRAPKNASESGKEGDETTTTTTTTAAPQGQGGAGPKPEKPDKFYTVTLHRTLGGKKPDGNPSSSCPKRWNDKTGRRCRRTEFVAISFQKSGGSGNDVDLDPEDLWYVCTVDEGHQNRISMWSQVSDGEDSGHQIIGTLPHLESGMGVVFSKIVYEEDIASMGCQFVIQESNMTLAVPPGNAAFFGNESHLPITVKLAAGYIKREEEEDDKIRRPFHSSDDEDFSYYNVYKGSDIIPTNEIVFEKLEVKLHPPFDNMEYELKTENMSLTRIEEVARMCENPEKHNHSYIACYPPSSQRKCIHTSRCPSMFIVVIPKTDTSFKTIKAHILGNIPDFPSLRKARRPMGFASVAFSKDGKMGRDVVITCHADGRENMNAYVSLNFQKANIYPGKISYDNLIFNVESYGSAEQYKILCSFEMNTSFVVNMFAYEPSYEDCIVPGESEKLEFDFKKETVHLLLAAGNRNYPGGKINFHDFSETLEEFFSEHLFRIKACEGLKGKAVGAEEDDYCKESAASGSFNINILLLLLLKYLVIYIPRMTLKLFDS